ncbi:MAG: GNVR domain-containing protein, partial [Bryobacteraceae bacterium]
ELINATERISTLRSQIASAARQIGALQKEHGDVVAKISDYQQRVERLPIVEQHMAALKRNYDESASYYNSLLQKELSAGMATDMERSHDSERFTLIDPALVPEIPIKPKRIRLAALGSILGLAIGVLLAFALEFRKRTFLGEWELPPGTVVLGRVPLIHAIARPATPIRTKRLAGPGLTG